MKDNFRTHQYLNKLEAVKIKTEIKVDTFLLPSYLLIFQREYYRKRNGKTCYVDKASKKMIPDMKRIKTGRFNNVYSTGENDWNPVVSKGTYYKLNPDYKSELINNEQIRL